MTPPLSRFLFVLVVETIAESPKHTSLLQSEASHRATPLALHPHAEQGPRTLPGEDNAHSHDVGFSMLSAPGLPQAGVSLINDEPHFGKRAAYDSQGSSTTGQMNSWADRIFRRKSNGEGGRACELIHVATECQAMAECRWDVTLEGRPSSSESYDEYEDGGDDDDEAGLCVRSSNLGGIGGNAKVRIQGYTTRGRAYSSKRYMDRDFRKFTKAAASNAERCATLCSEDRRCTLFRWQDEHSMKGMTLSDGSRLTQRMSGRGYPYKCHIYIGSTCAPQARFRASRAIIGRHWTYFISNKRWNLNCSEEEEKAALAGVESAGERASSSLSPLVPLFMLAKLLY
eukprot:GEMP01045937.1.p1 GENE.GEMP01045937.1~~GEMP01045937.1.p1  ORF type:complete len:400 (+),score=42.65 GEMP01045937.1:175-1200(+)